MARTKSPFTGSWRIVEMEQWERDYIDLEGPGLVKFERGGLGAMRFGAVDIGLDCLLDDKATLPRVDFSFEGTDEMDPCSGRGWAELRGEELFGMIYFHCGDNSWFKATRSEK